MRALLLLVLALGAATAVEQPTVPEEFQVPLRALWWLDGGQDNAVYFRAGEDAFPETPATLGAVDAHELTWLHHIYPITAVARSDEGVTLSFALGTLAMRHNRARRFECDFTPLGSHHPRTFRTDGDQWTLNDR